MLSPGRKVRGLAHRTMRCQGRRGHSFARCSPSRGPSVSGCELLGQCVPAISVSPFHVQGIFLALYSPNSQGEIQASNDVLEIGAKFQVLRILFRKSGEPCPHHACLSDTYFFFISDFPPEGRGEERNSGQREGLDSLSSFASPHPQGGGPASECHPIGVSLWPSSLSPFASLPSLRPEPSASGRFVPNTHTVPVSKHFSNE